MDAILQRRFMYRISEKLAQDKSYQTFITGEVIGQVASQTIENINATSEATNMTILRPLVGLDKSEIIEKAKAIGTYDLSIQPYQDCCHLFAPKNPTTKANLKKVLEAEKKLDVESLVKSALGKVNTTTP